MKGRAKNVIILANKGEVRKHKVKLNAKRLQKAAQGIKVHSFDTVDSTNKIAKELAANGCDEGVVVCALKQTAGKGRLGRTFLSERGGVYFSLVLRPKKDICDTLFITVSAAVAVARAIEYVSGEKCKIKWVNDVYIKGKKVCGILTEGGFGTNGTLDYAILGVGVNLFEPKNGFPSNLPLANSVFGKDSKIVFKKRKKERLIAEFIKVFLKFYDNLSQKEFIKEYQQRSFLTGLEITYTKDGNTYKGMVVGIDNDANLIVKIGEQDEKLSHGEIQIIGMEQPPI